MAIAIEGCTVVALKSRIEERFAGGVEALSKAAPNSTVLADDDLWRCSFMAIADAERFVQELQRSDLNVTDGPDPDLVLVNESDLSVSPYCEWLQVAQWEKGVVCWRAGTTPRSVVAPEGWSPEKGSGFSFVSSIDDEHLKFLRYDGNVSVYFDQRSGKEVYTGRTARDPEEEFKMACQAIIDRTIVLGQVRLTKEVEEDVVKAIATLQDLAEQFPGQWRILFFIGKGYSATGELDRAYASLRRAYELEAETESICRELAGVCLELGKVDEAVQLGEKAASLKPDDGQTLGNLACAYMLSGRLKEADATIDAALALNARDSTNRLLQSTIREIRMGQRAQPKHIRELTNPTVQTNQGRSSSSPTRKESFWSRFWPWGRRR